MRLALGTVQLGIAYGISNTGGHTSIEEATTILDVARENGVDLLDTAPAYGESESVIGRLLAKNHNFKIVSKIAHKKIEAEDVRQSFLTSLHNLAQSRLYGVLVHDANNLLVSGGDLLYKELLFLRQNGMVSKIGVSVYSSEQIDRLFDKYDFDLVQLSINVLDQRLLRSGHLTRLKNRGVEIHARSVFLQGLLLMDPEKLPEHFRPILKTLRNYRAFLASMGVTPLEAALGFIQGIAEIDKIIVGVNTAHQLSEILKAYKVAPDIDLSSFAIENDLMLNPSKWLI